MLRALDASRATSRAVKRDCFLLQRDITRWVVERVAADPVDARWEQLSEAERRAFLLGALRTTCGVTSDMPPRRSFVPEINITELVRGRAFLQLLESTCFDEMLPVDQEDGEFIPVPNERWTKMTEKLKANSRELRLQLIADFTASRNTFLLLFVWTVLLALDGRAQEYVPTRHSNGPDASVAEVAELLETTRLMQATEARETAEAWRRTQKAATHVCAKCDTPSSKLAVGKKLQKCGRCLPATALWYCDRACQVADWKKHKPQCGSPLPSANAPRTFTDTPPTSKKSSQSDEDAGFPPPGPGYKRSPALIAQIEALKESPGLDYVLFFPNPAPANAGAKIANAMGSMFFTLNRNRPMSTGDPRSVGMMYQQLEDSCMQVAEGFVLGKEGLKKQLSEEYGVDVDAELRRMATEKHQG